MALAGFVAGLAALFALINAAQLTSEDTGKSILRRAVAALIDIDSLAPALREEVKVAAEDSTEDNIEVPDFPVAVSLTREEALAISTEDLRGRLLDATVDRVYDDGLSALAATDPDAQRDIDLFSRYGLVDRGLGKVTDGSNNFFIALALVIGLITAVLGFLAIRAFSFIHPLSLVGLAVLMAALPSLLLCVLLRLALGSAQDDADAFVSTLLDVGEDALWAPIRNYIVFAILGAAFAIAGFVAGSRGPEGSPAGLTIPSERRQRPDDS